MAEYKLLFYETVDERCPSKEFLRDLPIKDAGKIARWLGLLERQGPQLLRPYADIVQGKIRELRVQLGGMQYRLLYFFWDRHVVITHGFVKKTSAIPDEEVARAIRAMHDFYRRLNQGGER